MAVPTPKRMRPQFPSAIASRKPRSTPMQNAPIRQRQTIAAASNGKKRIMLARFATLRERIVKTDIWIQSSRRMLASQSGHHDDRQEGSQSVDRCRIEESANYRSRDAVY